VQLPGGPAFIADITKRDEQCQHHPVAVTASVVAVLLIVTLSLNHPVLLPLAVIASLKRKSGQARSNGDWRHGSAAVLRDNRVREAGRRRYATTRRCSGMAAPRSPGGQRRSVRPGIRPESPAAVLHRERFQ